MKIPPEVRDVLLDSVEQSGETFFITDADGVILYVNPAFENLTGYSAAEVTGKKPNILKSGEHTKEFYDEMWRTIRAGKLWTGRLVNRRKDGTLYNEAIRINPIKNQDGAVKYFMTLRHDITRETALESQLQQSQKMESLGILAGQMAHDFNNLLTVVIGSMELVAEDLKPGSVSATLTMEILRSSKESASLIKQLMMFTRRSEAKPVPVLINEPLREVQILLDSLLGENIKTSYSLAEDLKPVKIDPAQLKQVVMNLAVNAKDIMAGKGTLTVITRSAGPKDLPPALPAVEYSVLEISDSGPGIPPQVLPRMFEPFFTTKPKGKGTGLGLSTVYGIVVHANGYIFAFNKPAGGAAFTIYLPVTNV
ncbi:MAG TPA: PAS domain S-box protein [Elusimicrobiales bacterium]|nr:PAS domain S-box protein [Elusimicrobiales bacterium]